MNFAPDTWWIVGTAITIAITIIGYFLKRTISKQDKHEEDINKIKLTYVTKDELKEVKDNVEDIKERMLTKQDYYRLQTQTEQKIDKIYDVLIKNRGDSNAK